LVLFANAEEVPSDSSLVIAQDSSSLVVQDSSLSVAQDSSSSIVQENSLSIANAKECEQEKTDYQKNLRMVAYLHPMSLFFGAAFNMFMITSTIEKPLSLSNSVIIQPSVWYGSSDGYIADVVEYEDFTRLGVGIGMRRYAVNKGSGFYLQAIASAYYTFAERIQYREKNDNYYGGYGMKSWIIEKGIILGELMLYIGSAHKWQNINIFYEGGLGLGYDGTNVFKIGYINKLATNFNFGIGIPF